MASNQAHHYVPQLLLRNFSTCPIGRRISTYLLSNDRFIYGASIRKQAQRKKLYKLQEVEDGLGEIETICAPIIQRYIDMKTLPLSSDEHGSLLTFFLLQLSRTPSSFDEHNRVIDQMAKAITPESVLPLDMHHAVKIVDPDIAINSVLEAINSLLFVKDLKIKFLVNNTENTFLISDNPVIHINPLADSLDLSYGAGGFASAGAMMIFPMASHIAAIAYDNACYRIGGMRSSSMFTDITKYDLDEINSLSIAHAQSQLFFSDNTEEDYIKKLVSETEHRREHERAIMESVTTTVINESLFLQRKVLHRLKMPFSFMKILRGSKNFIREDGMILHRIPELVKLRREFEHLYNYHDPFAKTELDFSKWLSTLTNEEYDRILTRQGPLRKYTSPVKIPAETAEIVNKRIRIKSKS